MSTYNTYSILGTGIEIVLPVGRTQPVGTVLMDALKPVDSFIYISSLSNNKYVWVKNTNIDTYFKNNQKTLFTNEINPIITESVDTIVAPIKTTITNNYNELLAKINGISGGSLKIIEVWTGNAIAPFTVTLPSNVGIMYICIGISLDSGSTSDQYSWFSVPVKSGTTQYIGDWWTPNTKSYDRLSWAGITVGITGTTLNLTNFYTPYIHVTEIILIQ